MNILVICTGNTCRSPMAEGILKSLIKEKGYENIKVSSMGLGAFDGQSPTSNAVEAMKEIGIDISQKKSQRVMLQDLTQTDYIYVMTQSQKDVITDALPQLEDKITVLDIPDPFAGDLSVYRECRDALLAFFPKRSRRKGRFFPWSRIDFSCCP